MRLKELREERDLTQNDIATAINTTRTNIGRWEKGLNEPSANFVILLANYFECTTDYLLGRSDDLGNVNIEKSTFNQQKSLTSNENKLLVRFRALPPDLQKRAFSYIEKLENIVVDDLSIITEYNHAKFNPDK